MTDDLAQKWSDPDRRGAPLDPGDAEAMMTAIEMPSIMIVTTVSNETDGAEGCWIGGAPTLPPEIEWPMIETDQLDGDDEDIFRPLHFLAQFDLSQVPLSPDMPNLPTAGTLFFFADYLDVMEGGPGYVAYPNYRVIYATGDVSDHPPRVRPETNPDFENDYQMYWAAWNPVEAFDKWPVAFSPFLDLNVNQFENDEFWTLAIRRRGDLFSSLPKSLEEATKPKSGFWGPRVPPGKTRQHPIAMHRFFGPNSPENSTAPSDDGVVQLLFFAQDRNINFEYEAGVSFCITKDDLEARDFSKAWAQTHSD